MSVSDARPVALGTLVRACLRRDFAIARSYRVPFVLDLVSVVFSLAAYFYLGRLVDTGGIRAALRQPQGYFAFVALGLMLLRLAQTGLTSIATRLRSEQTTGTLEALLCSPARAWQVMLAGSTFDVVQAGIAALSVIALAIALFGLRVTTRPVALAQAAAGFAATLLFVLAIGLALAAFTLLFKQATAALGFAVTALSLVGGVFFPVAVLPGPIQAVAEVIPFTWGVRLVRDALLAGRTDWPLFLALCGVDVLLLAVGAWLLERSVRRVRRTGTLGQY